jgi:hypothetical protein
MTSMMPMNLKTKLIAAATRSLSSDSGLNAEGHSDLNFSSYSRPPLQCACRAQADGARGKRQAPPAGTPSQSPTMFVGLPKGGTASLHHGPEAWKGARWLAAFAALFVLQCIHKQNRVAATDVGPLG